MSEIVDITVGVIQEEITISAVNNIGEITVNAVSNSEEVNITANTNLIQININTAPISIINPQDYDLSQFTNTSSNPFVQQSALSTYVPIYRTIKINGVQQDLSADREWNFPVAVWGSITGTLASQTDLQAALNAKVPTSRTLTINGTSYDLSADRSWTISTGITIGTTAITSGVVGRVLFEGVGNVVQESADLFWDNINGRLGLGTSNPTARLQVNGTATIQNGSSRGLTFTPWTLGANIDPVTASNNLYFGRDVAFSNIVFQTGNVLVNTTTDAGYKLDVNGTIRATSAITTDAHAYLNQGVWCDIYRNRFGVEVFRITLTSNNMLIGTTTDVASSLVTMESTTKGFLLPRMTNTQVLAIATPATGLQAYDTTNNKLMVYDATAWRNIATENWVTSQGYLTTQPWVVSGSNIYYSTGSVGIGTSTPASPLDVNGQIQSNLGLNLDKPSGQTQIYFRENGTLRTQLTSNYADGNFYLYHGGANRLVVTNSGNVGIGITNPTNTLQVNGTFNSLALWTNLSGITSWGNSGSVAFGGLTWGTGYAMVYSTPGNTLNFGTNGSTTRMTISTAGNVSIGDSVFPSASWTNALTIGPNSTNKIITGYLASSTNGAVIGAHNSALNAWADLNIVADAIIFRRLGEVEAMRIANTGNVLIGTSTDAGFRLDVNGTSRFSGLTNFNNNVVLNSNWLYIGPNGGNVLLRPVSTTNLQLFNNNAGATLFLNANGSVQLGSSNVVNWATFSASGHTIYGTTNTNFFSSGNVGINTATDAGYKFDVNGTMRVTDTTILGSTNQILTFTPTATLPLLEQNGSVGSRIRTTSGTRLLQLENYSGDANYLSASGAGLWIRTTDSNPVYFRTNNTTAGQISANQNWTIGGTIDAGYKLDVIGTARVSTSVESLEFRTDAGGNNFYRTAEIFMQSTISAGLITIIAQRALIVQNVNNGTNRDGALFSIGPVSSLSVPQQNMYFNRLLGTLQLYNGGAQNFDSTANLASSILSLESTTKGFLPPRMTTTQKNAIATPATGLVVYDTTLNALSSFNGTTWSSGGGGATWGSITGTLSTQTDLQSALDAKVPYTGATTNVDLGEWELKAGQVEFDQTPTGTAGTAIMRWNDQDGTVDLGLKGGNVTLQIGQEQVTRVVNKTGSNLLEANYQAVRISGAQGNRLKVDLAQANNDANSADTIGIVTETINDNQEGFVTTSGLVRNIDTTGSLQSETWADGDMLYLSGTVAGQLTNVKPAAPIHTIIMGYVVRAHATQGQIYVKVDNGYELDELHNVYINPATLANGDTLIYDSSTSLWKNGAGGGGGGGSIIKLTGQTLAVGSWSLVGSYYQYTFSNASITANTRVDFTPDNASYSEVTTCGMLPQVDETTGSCTFYSLFPPQSNITGEITIFPTI